MAKDARHEEGVIAAGGVFFPLVVGMLGLWTTHSLKTLWLIATRASALSGITRGQAFSNLIQQLSVKLWCYNSKLVIARLVNQGLSQPTGTSSFGLLFFVVMLCFCFLFLFSLYQFIIIIIVILLLLILLFYCTYCISLYVSLYIYLCIP